MLAKTTGSVRTGEVGGRVNAALTEMNARLEKSRGFFVALLQF
jgi:hypothetical protein